MRVELDSSPTKELQIFCCSSDVESNSKDKGEIVRVPRNPQKKKTEHTLQKTFNNNLSSN